MGARSQHLSYAGFRQTTEGFVPISFPRLKGFIKRQSLFWCESDHAAAVVRATPTRSCLKLLLRLPDRIHIGRAACMMLGWRHSCVAGGAGGAAPGTAGRGPAAAAAAAALAAAPAPAPPARAAAAGPIPLPLCHPTSVSDSNAPDRLGVHRAPGGPSHAVVLPSSSHESHSLPPHAHRSCPPQIRHAP